MGSLLYCVSSGGTFGTFWNFCNSVQILLDILVLLIFCNSWPVQNRGYLPEPPGPHTSENDLFQDSSLIQLWIIHILLEFNRILVQIVTCVFYVKSPIRNINFVTSSLSLPGLPAAPSQIYVPCKPRGSTRPSEHDFLPSTLGLWPLRVGRGSWTLSECWRE